jgi:hypothetical protein
MRAGDLPRDFPLVSAESLEAVRHCQPATIPPETSRNFRTAQAFGVPLRYPDRLESDDVVTERSEGTALGVRRVRLVAEKRQIVNLTLEEGANGSHDHRLCEQYRRHLGLFGAGYVFEHDFNESIRALQTHTSTR